MGGCPGGCGGVNREGGGIVGRGPGLGMGGGCEVGGVGSGRGG